MLASLACAMSGGVLRRETTDPPAIAAVENLHGGVVGMLGNEGREGRLIVRSEDRDTRHSPVSGDGVVVGRPTHIRRNELHTHVDCIGVTSIG